MTAARIALAECCEIVQGGRHKLSGNDFVEDGFPAYGAGGMNGLLATWEFDEAAVVLSSIGARCGKCFYVDGKWSSLANTQVIRPNPEKVDCKFLWYQLNDESRWPRSGTGQPFIKPSDVKKHLVRLPPLPEQRRIAAILDKADALRTKRREALAQLDRLAQSIFVEMFGDPVTNPKGWPWQPLGSIATKFSDGPFGSNLKSEHYVETGVRVVRLQNIGVGEFIDNDKAFVSQRHYETIRKHECVPGDVLVGTLGDPNLRACIQPDSIPLAINKADCVQIRVNPKVANAFFVSALLNHPSTEQLAQDLKHGQTRVRISMGSLRGLEVPIPPIHVQQEFALRIKSLNELRTSHEMAALEQDDLFASLQHRAFRGEL